MAATSMSVRDAGGNLRDVAQEEAAGIRTPRSAPEVAGAAVSTSNPMPVALPAGPQPVSGSAAAGAAPTSAPLSVSGVDGGGLKRHLRTENDGALVATVRPSINLTQAQVSVGTTSGPLAAANSSRRYFGVFNPDPAASVTISVAATAVSGQGYVIPPRGGYVFDANATPTNAFTCIGTAPCNLTVWEG